MELILQQNPVIYYKLYFLFWMVLKLYQPFIININLAEFMAQNHSLLLIIFFPSVSRVILKKLVGITANIQRLIYTCLIIFLYHIQIVQPWYWIEDKEEDIKLYQL